MNFRKRLVLSWRLRFSRETPLIVYQMGKVGSSSVVASLKQAGLPVVFHVHRMHPENIRRVREECIRSNQVPANEILGRTLYSKIVRKEKRAKYITLVREPIGRNISAFFENFARFTGVEYEESQFSTEELMDLFVTRYDHEVPLTWFDVEMKRTLGVDVYEYEFPRKDGVLRVDGTKGELLILKLETDDSVKEKAIAEFLDINDFVLTGNNIGRKKAYGETYEDFLLKIRLPGEYVHLMCHAAYTRHFYSEEEIDDIRSRWGAKAREDALPPGIGKTLSRASRREAVTS